MKPDREIDSALRSLGSARPPEGMERRIHARLDAAPRRFPARYTISAAAVAAGVLIFAVVLSPANRSKSQREDAPLHSGVTGSAQQQAAQDPARDMEQQIMARPRGSFGIASAVHVPDQPVALEPTPVGQRRGHTRASGASTEKAGVPSPKKDAAEKPTAPAQELTPEPGFSGSIERRR